MNFYPHFLDIIDSLKNEGFVDGKIKIDNCCNEKTAEAFKTLVLSTFPEAEVEMGVCLGLCSFYAENGGLLIGFEKGSKK